VTDIAFESWPKTPRLFKESMVVTEKIDGTNSAVGVVEGWTGQYQRETGYAAWAEVDGRPYTVYAQSRNRLIGPAALCMEKGSDNYNFAAWVFANKHDLARVLGPGLHFGEWWGHGIGRGYGMAQGQRFFSLFNTSRWKHLDIPEAREAIQPPDGLRVVPVLNVYTLDTGQIRDTLDILRLTGSRAAPGYMNPEGVCVFIPGAKQTFKVTFDDEHKSQQARALAEAGA